jgi:uncharacterized protein involved in tellurium resistance
MRFGVIGPLGTQFGHVRARPAVTLSSSDRGQMSEDVDDVG